MDCFTSPKKISIFLTSMAMAISIWIAGLGSVEANWKTLTLVNKCKYDVWPGIAANAGYRVVAQGGMYLGPGHWTRVAVPWNWQGRIWARTGCHSSPPTNNNSSSLNTFSCETGDCGSGKVECLGNIGLPPVTLAQFSFQPSGKYSYYDVSVVDGFNVPMSVSSSASCGVAGCFNNNVLKRCPKELQVLNTKGELVACKSACLAFDRDEFCCRNQYGTPSTCSPSFYSKLFKEACPSAYSYAFDTPPPLYTCDSATFTVTFCPSTQRSNDREVA